jgi:hypothetical protein
MGKGSAFMFLSRRASVPKFNLVRCPAWLQPPERRQGPVHAHANGFHDNATLTLSPNLTTAVAASIAACTLGVSVTVVVLSIQAVMSMPA